MPETSQPADALVAAVHDFMPGFIVQLNPLLHRTRYQDRSFSELEVIVVLGLAMAGPMRPGRLSHDLGVEKGSLTSVIRRLEGLGLVERHEAAGDARGYFISLTSQGAALVEHLAEQRTRGFRALFAGMPPDEVDAAVRGLEVLTRHLRARMPGSRTR
ncbi:MAG: MarR family transcriptional regulator [Propionicimonas sp.]|nr:MarR family transcriptional regulator [Propionicimonas sp.]